MTNDTGSRARAAVSAAFAANGFAAGSWSPLVPVLMDRLGIDKGDVGFLILAGGTAGLAGLLAAPRLIGRLGSRAVAIAAGLLLAPGPLLMALAPSHAVAALAFVWLFLFLSVMDVAINANGAELERRRGHAVMSSFHGFWSLGAMAAAGAGGFLIARAGATGQTLTAAAVMLGLVAFAATGLVRTAADRPRMRGSGLTAHPRILLLGLLALTAFVVEGAIVDWSAVYLRRELGAPVEVSGFGFAAFSAAMLAARFTGDALRRRLGSVRLIRLSALLAGAGYLVAGLGGSLPLVIAGFALTGLGAANLVPLAFSAAARQTALPPGAGIATVTIMGYTGLLLAPALLGNIAEATGFAAIFVALAIPTAALALLAREADDRH
jgi:fucose permease